MDFGLAFCSFSGYCLIGYVAQMTWLVPSICNVRILLPWTAFLSSES